MIQLVVFDVDGTLVDSQHTIAACLGAAFVAAGLAPPTLDATRRIVGLPLVEGIGRLAPDLDPAICEGLVEGYRTAFRGGRHRCDEPLFDGIGDLLEALRQAGIRLGIATGKGRPGLEATLGRHGLLPLFETLQTGDCHPGKPDPAMLQAALAETGLPPTAALMIGDTSFDMLMAGAAGVRGIGVAWGYHPIAELVEAGAEAVVETADAIARLAQPAG